MNLGGIVDEPVDATRHDIGLETLSAFLTLLFEEVLAKAESLDSFDSPAVAMRTQLHCEVEIRVLVFRGG